MKSICKNCQYQRKPGEMDAAVAGKGYWCSNSQSKLFMHRVVHENSCEKFQVRGAKAGFVYNWQYQLLEALQEKLSPVQKLYVSEPMWRYRLGSMKYFWVNGQSTIMVNALQCEVKSKYAHTIIFDELLEEKSDDKKVW